eukprot:9199612-Pyramimonas_sp.AAC.1
MSRNKNFAIKQLASSRTSCQRRSRRGSAATRRPQFALASCRQGAVQMFEAEGHETTARYAKCICRPPLVRGQGYPLGLRLLCPGRR